MRVLLVGSSGGHLAQMHRLRPWWSQHEREWVTFDTPDAVALLRGEVATWCHHPTTRDVPNLLRNTALAWQVVTRFQPDVVLSTGAAVAVPFFLVARATGARTVYLEVYDRIDSPTLSGRLCRPLSDAFLLQWDDQLASYPGGTVVGPVFA